nr:reverse transcriptase domain-containing protein [Tanacetum cinerariifolium]
MTRSAGRSVAESLEGGTGVRVGRGGRGRRPREIIDERFDDLNGQGNDQGMGANGGVEGVNGNVNMSWNDFKFMMIEEFCPSHEMQKLETELMNHAMVEAGYAAYTDRFHKLARLVPHLVNPRSRKIERYVHGLALQIRRMVAATEPKTMQKAVQISGALTDKAVRNGSIKKVKKRGYVGEPSTDKNGRDDNKRTRAGNAFATTANCVGRENVGSWLKCATYNSYRAPRGPCHTCFNYNRSGLLAKDCRGMPRNVNPVNARIPLVRACYECGSTDHVRSACPRWNRAQGPGGNRPNQVVANNEGQCRGNQENQARVKKDIDEIETINIELDHRVSKLIAENEHLKQTYKQLYDSIKPICVRSKERCDTLINQVNQKSVEIFDLNANLQEKGLIMAALRDELRKLKGKALVDNAVTTHTIASEMLKIDVEPLAPRLEVVEQGKSQNPLNNSLDSACKYTK